MTAIRSFIPIIALLSSAALSSSCKDREETQTTAGDPIVQQQQPIGADAPGPETPRAAGTQSAEAQRSGMPGADMQPGGTPGAEAQPGGTPGADMQPGGMRGAAGEPTPEVLAASCPMAVQGATLQRTDTEDGVALVFTTSGANVAEVRQRTRNLAKMYETHSGREAGMGMGHHGGMGGPAGAGHGPGHGAGPGAGPEVRTTVTDIDQGARLELTPVDENELETLRQRVQRHEPRLRMGECRMMMLDQPTDASPTDASPTDAAGAAKGSAP